MMDYQNLAAGTMLTGWQNAMTAAAKQAADNAYQQATLAGASDDRALAAAKFAWQQKLDEANQTGMWNGQWNNPQEQWFTGQFGQWYGPGGAPQAGDQTLQANQQYYNQAYQNSQLYGQYYAPGTTPMQGTATQQAQQNAANMAAQRAGLTGYLQNTGSGNTVADAWNMLDQATQQQYLQTSPGQNDQQEAMNRYYQNLQNAVYNAARQAGQAVTPQTMNDYIYGGGGQGQQTLAGNQQQFSQNMQAQQLALQTQNQYQTQAQNYLQLMSQLRGPADYAKYQQVLGSTPQGMKDLVGAAMGQYVPGGGATTGQAPQAATLQTMQQQIAGGGGTQPGTGTAAEATGGGTNVFGNLPAPNQIAAQSWKNLAPSQQQMLLGAYESQGWNKDDVSALMNQSMPKYASNAPGAGTWRLQ